MSEKSKQTPVRFLSDIQSGVRRNTAVTVVALVAALLISCFAVFYAFDYVKKDKDSIYILDQGAVLSAFRSEDMAQRDQEIVDHMKDFHMLFFRISPDADRLQQGISDALELADESAYAFYNDLLEKQYYDKLLSINAVQDIRVDSVRFDLGQYPYPVRTYCSLFIYRESNVSTYDYQTTCELVNVPRSMNNPHGLLIQKFREDKTELKGTRKRKR